jgi:outer membrane protein OmpA-like peptidoglycan-associated protein
VDVNKRGLVLRLGEVLFDFDSAVLKKDARETINTIINILKQRYPDRELIVEGHTDNAGTRQYNKSLSERRAESVAKYLRDRQEFEKLSFRGLGQEQPIADNGTKDGRKKNRRVEIIIKLR